MDERERDNQFSPRPQSEGVRIIGAEEAQAALEAGQAEGRRPDDAPRFGDVPPPPAGPRSPHRFPLPDSVDPASAVPRPAVKAPDRHFGSRFGRNKSNETLPGSAPGPRVVRLVPPSETEGPDWEAAASTQRSETGGDRGAHMASPTGAAGGWGDNLSWPDTTVPRSSLPRLAPVPEGAEPLPEGTGDDSGRHFAKDPVAAGPMPWAMSTSGGDRYADPAATSLDPAAGSRPSMSYEPRGPGAPDMSLPDEGINVHSGSMPDLPHWTDPPTGEVPFILPDREPSQGEEMAAWQALGSRGLRWRDEASDWDDLDDVSDLGGGDETPLGALDTNRTEHSDVYSFDEQFDRLEDQRSGAVPVVDPSPAAPAPRSTASRSGGRATGSLPPHRSTSGVGTSNGRSPRGPVGGGRDLTSATIVGVGMLLALGVAYVLGSAALMVLSTLIVTASALELYNLIQHRGFRPATLLGVAATVAVMLAAYGRGSVAQPLILVLVFVTSMLWYMLRVVDARPVVNIGLTMMTFVWVGIFGSYASLLLQVPRGKQLLLLPILVTVAADTVAYFAGSSFGNRPLAPNVSPGKTWEGVIAGGIGAIVLSFLLSRLPLLSKTWSGNHALLLGLVVAVVAPLGDLCESMVKRDLDLKDSGSFLPGHGGLLDRFDALLFVLPATYYLLLYLRLS